MPTILTATVDGKLSTHESNLLFTAARLAQLGKRRSAEREVTSSNPGRTNTQGLKNNKGESAVFVMTSAMIRLSGLLG